MTLEDFEKELAAKKAREEHPSGHGSRHKHRHRDEEHRSHRHRSRSRDRRHRHHRSHRHEEDESRHRHKRRRRESDQHERGLSSGGNDVGEDDEDGSTRPEALKRDSWMQAPSSNDVEYKSKPKPASPPQRAGLEQNFRQKLHEKELNHQLREVRAENAEQVPDTNVQRDLDYEFGDAGSSWRMTKLKAVYKQAEETGKEVEDVAVERFGDLRSFDDAREEEIELERRDRLGADYVGKIKPSGELYQDRKLDAGAHKPHDDDLDDALEAAAVTAIPVPAPMQNTNDQTNINKLKAQLLKAQLRKDPNLSSIQAQYDAAISNQPTSTTITLTEMDAPQLTSTRGETVALTGRRNESRGNLTQNHDMTIADMVAEERRTRHLPNRESLQAATRIAKDSQYTNDLDYQDDNATSLSTRTHQSSTSLRNATISSYQKTQKMLETCPLCHHETNIDPTPVAPIISLATRTYLTLSTLPELAKYTTLIVPTTHHSNLLHCDDDEWEELRNFMKSLTRYHHSRGNSCIFYENAARNTSHAALVCVPLTDDQREQAPAFFREAFLLQADEWAQHRKIIDTLAGAKERGMGRNAFRRMIAREIPYFHVWLDVDGGMGQIVEEVEKWPRGDGFARGIIGGIVGAEAEIVRKQGRWVRGGDKERIERFRRGWGKWDWTKALLEQT